MSSLRSALHLTLHHPLAYLSLQGTSIVSFKALYIVSELFHAFVIIHTHLQRLLKITCVEISHIYLTS